jgi:hypothetical protein
MYNSAAHRVFERIVSVKMEGNKKIHLSRILNSLRDVDCDALWSCRCLPTFRRNVLPPLSTHTHGENLYRRENIDPQI